MILFAFSSIQVPKNYEKCPFYFWFHTAFVKDNSLILTRWVDHIIILIIMICTINFIIIMMMMMMMIATREELDNPHKSKTWDVFRESLKVELRSK